MKRSIALFLVVTLLISGLEYVSDYREAFEGTDLAAIPDGHNPNDGHDSAEHQGGCDNCHFGGVHLMGIAQTPFVQENPLHDLGIPWQMPAAAYLSPTPPIHPPIV